MVTTTNKMLISILRKNPQTINELVELLKISRNAIVFHLGQLEANGLIERGQIVHTKRVGKPAIQYKAIEGLEDSHSSIYRSFSLLLIKQLVQQISSEKMNRIMRRIGKDMAKELDVDQDLPIHKRMALAKEFVDSLGAATEIENKNNQYIIKSNNCPLASAVRLNECACRVLQSFFLEATGCRVEKMCDGSDKLFCQFIIHHHN